MKTITTALLVLSTLLCVTPRRAGAEQLTPKRSAPADASRTPVAGQARDAAVAERSTPRGNRLAAQSTRPSAAARLGGERSTRSPVLTALSALAIVVGLFLAVAWLAKRKLPAASRLLPEEVLEVLGRAPLAARQDAHLIRLGKKLLLVCVSAAGTETLTEITDPEEVDRLAGLCKQLMPRSSTASFRHVLQRVSREPAASSFVDEGVRSGARTARRTAQAGRPSHV